MARECCSRTSGLWQSCGSAAVSGTGFEAGSHESGVEVESALAFAMAGDTARAESLALDLGKRFPLHNQMQSLWVPAIQAQLSLDKKNPAAALTALQAPSSIELGSILFVT